MSNWIASSMASFDALDMIVEGLVLLKFRVQALHKAAIKL